MLNSGERQQNMNFSAGQPKMGMGATSGSQQNLGGVKFDQK